MTNVARPFLKWVGGKTQLLDRIVPILPKRIRTYYEPFIGGGALFFTLAHLGQFQRAVINDWNGELVDTYKAIRDFPDDLILRLGQLKAEYLKDPPGVFALERMKAPRDLSPIDRAARFIFLNKTGFNGLYRVNLKGVFNVPFGKHEDPPILDEENIRACRKVLNHFVVITNRDFAEAVEDAQPGDCVYFDPPYVPANPTSSFTKYTKEGFGLEAQKRLATTFRTLVDRGVAVIASNSDTPLVRELYDGFELHEIQARRSINSVGKKRGPVGELVIVGRQGTPLPSIPPPPPEASEPG